MWSIRPAAFSERQSGRAQAVIDASSAFPELPVAGEIAFTRRRLSVADPAAGPGRVTGLRPRRGRPIDMLNLSPLQANGGVAALVLALQCTILGRDCRIFQTSNMDGMSFHCYLCKRPNDPFVATWAVLTYGRDGEKPGRRPAFSGRLLRIAPERQLTAFCIFSDELV